MLLRKESWASGFFYERLLRCDVTKKTSQKGKRAAGESATSFAQGGSGPTLEFESQLRFPERVIVGVDEVGRGCLAGPVVAAAAIFPSTFEWNERALEDRPWLRWVRDSKKLSAERRSELAPLLKGFLLGWAIGEASVEEIDRLNIYHASHLAMVRALSALSTRYDAVLVDGNRIPKGITAPSLAVVKGDDRSLSIAAASILAKVYRDQGMDAFESQYPGYGFAQHKGYGTPVHTQALRDRGPTPIHRRSFAPVAELL
jgi:ribonuclease HII